MKGNDHSTGRDFDLETAPDLSRDGWPEKFAKASVRRGRPPAANPKVSTTLRLSPDVIDHFKAEGRGWRRESTKRFVIGLASRAPHD